MSKLNDGGAAFPLTGLTEGMSLRDYFAGKALSALATTSGLPKNAEELIAEASYNLADAMLKAREQ